MKSEMLTSLKFKRLCKVLGLPKPHVIGLLELLWQTGYAAASDVIGDEVDVETACEWEGEPGALAKALLAERWLDIDESLTIRIHDFWEHAPQYVERKRSRLDATRSKIEEKRSKRAAVDRANASRERRKSTQQQEVTEESETPDRRLDSDASVASQQLAYPTQPNPTQPNPVITPSANNERPVNDVEDSFAARGITLETGEQATTPPERTAAEKSLGLFLRDESSLAKYHLTGPNRRALAALLESDGMESFRRAFSAAADATPMRRGAGFVSYVTQTLGSMAADRDGKGRAGSARNGQASRKPLNAKVVYE